MSFVPFSIPGVLSASWFIEISPSPREGNILSFSPSVNVAPTGAPLVLRVQTAAPGLGPAAEYIEATIAAGEYSGNATGELRVNVGDLVYVLIESAPSGGSAAEFLFGYFELTDGVSIGPVEDVNRTTFERTISNIVNRGTQFDSFIPGAVRRAIRFFENGNNFPYMRTTYAFSRLPGTGLAENQPQLTLSRLIKRIDFVRSYDPTASSRQYTYLTGVPFDDVGELRQGTNPEFYYTTHQNRLHGDMAETKPILHLGTLSFASALNFDVGVYTYTDYQNFFSFDEHWLLTTGEDVLIAQTMINLAPIIRQPNIVQIWAPVVAMGLPNLLLAADEMDVDQHAQQIGY